MKKERVIETVIAIRATGADAGVDAFAGQFDLACTLGNNGTPCANGVSIIFQEYAQS